MSKPIQFYSRFGSRKLILKNKDGSESKYVFPGHYATLYGSGVRGVTNEDHIAQMRLATKRMQGFWEMTEEELNPTVVPDQPNEETRVKMDDGTYRVISNAQLKAMVELAEETALVTPTTVVAEQEDQKSPLVVGGAELKVMRKGAGLSIREASQRFEVSVATISRWENLGELVGKSLAMYEELKVTTTVEVA